MIVDPDGAASWVDSWGNFRRAVSADPTEGDEVLFVSDLIY